MLWRYRIYPEDAYNQLKDGTGQDFGYDVDAWRAWMATQDDPLPIKHNRMRIGNYLITSTDLEFLTSDAGEQLLTKLTTKDVSEQNTLNLVTQLRKTYTQAQSGAALSLVRVRQKAVAKFGESAAKMYFTETALQQASDPLIRNYRAKKYGRVLDVCCGIGADSLAFAAAGADVLGLDLDPVRVEMARLNAAALGLSAKFEIADVTKGVPASDYDLVFFDPARRDAKGKRIKNVEHYIPSLWLVNNWDAQRMMAKISPGVDLAQVENFGGGIEFISVSGDLKEAVLHLGGDVHGMQATLLKNNKVYHWRREDDEPGLLLREPQDWLIEPDPAIIRAGLVRDIAATHDGMMLDETIAYFTTSNDPNDVWLRAWQIRDWMVFNLKKLRAYLREHNIGTVTVKKRGSRLTPEELIPKLKLKGEESATLVLTRHKNKMIVMICDDIAVN